VEVIPAIDLKGGRCVRLYQGDMERQEVFSEDPLAVALKWQEQGAPRLHIVDLDGAVAGRPVNLGVINGVAALVDVPVQVGGGIRGLESAQRLIDMGVARIVLGTAAVEEPGLVSQMLARFGPQAIVVSVDARGGMVAIKGWREGTDVAASQLIKEMAALGVVRFVYTDIARDGTLTSPNFEAIAEVVRHTRASIVASGGVASVDHLVRLVGLGVEGAIVGRALYTGAVALKDAIEAVQSVIGHPGR
jgi:phosphoribosylformimino-5-aminoimidazole carboxamide ribotide isomerase